VTGPKLFLYEYDGISVLMATVIEEVPGDPLTVHLGMETVIMINADGETVPLDFS
jgi:hypothetical protein